MRRRTLLLTAGLLAYFIGATFGVYLRPDADECRDSETGCRILVFVQHPRATLDHPLLAIKYLVTSKRSG